MKEAVLLEPKYVPCVWGGQRLMPQDPPIGEAWVVYEQNRVVGGPYAGKTLEQLVQEQGLALLGSKVRPGRFPLLVKLLDTADWLSVQVHPDDAQALALGGAGQLGKTEAWHILEAAPGAEVICGVRPGTSVDALWAGLGTREMLELVQRVGVQAGDTVLVEAGTLHALGPGLLLYEVQQTSDITYRIYDWDRPMKAGRALHLEQSRQVVNPSAAPLRTPLPEAGRGELTACPYFRLELLAPRSKGLALHTRGESFHALTAIDGEASVQGEGWSCALKKFQTALIPAAVGAYALEASKGFRALKATAA